MDNGTQELSPRAALDELDRVGAAVRHRSRWYGWYLLVLGAGTVVYYAAVELTTPAPSQLVILSLSWTGFVVTLSGWARRQPVMWQGLRQLRRPLMALYFVLIAVTVALSSTVLSDQPGRWLLGLVAALPCLAGGWQVLRR